ncbi:hypothetical protein OKW38_002326 [Paraburkholderia sp. MM5496-R1]|uniref:Uncharacterized protein n=1 Tax=Paraburkholderia tuberum TaxID=157910 RepID=A0A1H1GR24_9BURK|nr:MULTISPECIES: hypothetical protein [Paraburkholderia]MBC8720688.1 hypothetical protein [Paraburkholderia sp. 31.1]SDR15591.1 hypothetical protein SAMN05445850_3030 [Paraburkholderia tuberum]
MTSPIPQSFDDWQHCIEHECGITLTPAFIQARLAVLGDPDNAETQRFARLYGEVHLQRVLGWFAAALENTSLRA